MWIVALCVALVPHMYLDRAGTASFLHRWRPRVMDHATVSHEDVRLYMLARLELEETDSVGGLMRTDGDLFVVHHATPDLTVIQAAMCRDSEMTLGARFLELREWHRAVFPNATLDADLPPNEQEVWEIVSLA